LNRLRAPLGGDTPLPHPGCEPGMSPVGDLAERGSPKPRRRGQPHSRTRFAPWGPLFPFLGRVMARTPRRLRRASPHVGSTSNRQNSLNPEETGRIIGSLARMEQQGNEGHGEGCPSLFLLC